MVSKVFLYSTLALAAIASAQDYPSASASASDSGDDGYGGDDGSLSSADDSSSAAATTMGSYTTSGAAAAVTDASSSSSWSSSAGGYSMGGYSSSSAASWSSSMGGYSAAATSAGYSAAATASSAAASAAATGAGQTVHVVQVGANGLTFSPNNVQAAVGDVVQFQFNPKNHSVVQSTFGQPCVPIQNEMANVTGFFSGFMPVTDIKQGQPVYSILINDTKPIWYYCSQAKHCQMGMVGAINAATSGNKTVDAFKGLAAMAPDSITPGQSSGAGAQASGYASGTGSLPAATNGASTTTTAPKNNPSNSASGFSPASGMFFGAAAAFVAGVWML